MKVSYEWLKEMLDGPMPSAEKVAEALTFGAFEIEGIEKRGNDTVLDVKVLPNRAADCLSHRGIAKEIVTLLPNLSLKNDPYLTHLPVVAPSPALSVHIEEKELCTRYMGALMTGVKVGPSPAWLKARLEALGQRSINNIVDITNYVMLETGQPLHAFDAKKLTVIDGGWAIGVRTAKRGEDFLSLSGDKYDLHTDDLVITDAHTGHIIGLAGVKGGKLAEVSDETHTIIIEAAHFVWNAVRKTSTRHRLTTDASQRFANNLSPHLPAYGMARVLALIKVVAGGEVQDLEDTNPSPPRPRPIDVHLEKINSRLGVSLSEADVDAIFERMGLTFERGGTIWTVTPPLERTDLLLPEDIAEEIGRIAGYSHLKGVPLPSPSRPVVINDEHAHAGRVRGLLLGTAASEVMTSVFVPKNEGEVALENPLAEDRPRLRRHIAPGLMRALAQNARNAPILGLSEIVLFEIGHVFIGGGKEELHLAIAVHAPKKKRATERLGEIVGILEQELGVTLPPARSSTSEIAEFSLSKIFPSLPRQSEYPRVPLPEERVRFTHISPYPFVLRDIAVWAGKGVQSGMVAARIVPAAGPLLVRCDLFDEFSRDDKVSFAFHLVFQSNEKTLTDIEVGEHMVKVEDAIRKSGWTVR